MLIHLLTEKQGVGRKYVNNLAESLRGFGHEVELIYKHEECSKGDMLFILGYLKIIPKKWLLMHPKNLVIHASDLPKGKGWSPVAWQILEGKNEIPFTLFEADEELDAGDIYFQRILMLKGNEVFEEWRDLQWRLIVDMVIDFVKNHQDYEAKSQHGKSSYYRKRTAKDDELDVNLPLAQLFDKIRICDPKNYPAWFQYRERRFEIKISPISEDC